MKISDIRQKSSDDLRVEIRKIHAEHYGLRFRKVTDVIENPEATRALRKDLARIHTVIREREISAQVKPAAPVAPAKPAAAKPEKAVAKKPAAAKKPKAAKTPAAGKKEKSAAKKASK